MGDLQQAGRAGQHIRTQWLSTQYVQLCVGVLGIVYRCRRMQQHVSYDVQQAGTAVAPSHLTSA